MRDVTTAPAEQFNLVNLAYRCPLLIKETVVSTVEQCYSRRGIHRPSQLRCNGQERPEKIITEET